MIGPLERSMSDIEHDLPLPTRFRSEPRCRRRRILRTRPSPIECTGAALRTCSAGAITKRRAACHQSHSYPSVPWRGTRCLALLGAEATDAVVSARQRGAACAVRSAQPPSRFLTVGCTSFKLSI